MATNWLGSPAADLRAVAEQLPASAWRTVTWRQGSPCVGDCPTLAAAGQRHSGVTRSNPSLLKHGRNH